MAGLLHALESSMEQPKKYLIHALNVLAVSAFYTCACAVAIRVHGHR